MSASFVPCACLNQCFFDPLDDHSISNFCIGFRDQAEMISSFCFGFGRIETFVCSLQAYHLAFLKSTFIRFAFL